MPEQLVRPRLTPYPHEMATHTHTVNDIASESAAGNLRWIYDQEFEAILHDGPGMCLICSNWKDHYQLSQRLVHPSLTEARQAHHRAVHHSFESRVDSLEREHNEMLQEVAALQRELEQVQIEIKEVRKDQVRIINSNLERKC